MKSQKLSEIKDKKKMKKRASVAILVDKLEVLSNANHYNDEPSNGFSFSVYF